MLTYFRDLWRGIVTVLNSMAVAWKHLFTRSVTLQYPTQKWTMPERSRGRLLNRIDDCLGDGQCARVCPTGCITVKSEKRGKDEPEVTTSTGAPKKLRTYQFDIDMTKCCYCALCTFVCPTGSLIMTPEYEYSVYDRKDHLYHFATETQQGAAPTPKETTTVKV